MQKQIKGNAQQRFDQRMRRGFDLGHDPEEGYGIEAIARTDRTAADGLAFSDEALLIQRLRDAGSKLVGDRGLLLIR